MSVGHGDRWLLAAVLLLAAGLRAAAGAVWWEDLSRDPDAYREYAERLLDGRGYAAPDGRPTAFRPPLYPFLLATVLWAGPAGVAVTQIAFGVATAGLTAGLGRRLGLGRWSLFAAALVAADPLLLRYTPQVMTEVTGALLAALVLWLAADGRRPLLLGVAFGLAALSRPTFWAFGALAAAAWLLDCKSAIRNPQSAIRLPPAGRRAALVLLGTSLVVAPWAARNAVMLGRPVLTTTHGGYTLLLANNPVFWREVVAGPPGATWEGASLEAWQSSLEAAMAEDGIAPGDELARDRWAKRRALEHIREHPTIFLRSTAYRVRRLWDVSPVGEAGSLPAGARWGVTLFYVVVFGLAITGLVRLAIERRRAAGGSRQIPPGASSRSVVGPPLLGERGRGEGSDAALGSDLHPIPSIPDPRADARGSPSGEGTAGHPLTPGPSPQGEGRRRGGASWRPALLLVVAFTAVHAVYWTDTRMRAPLVPAVAVLAARGLSGVPVPRSLRLGGTGT